MGSPHEKVHAAQTMARRANESEYELRQAIKEHRRKIMLLGHRPDERTGEPVWGGQFDRDLWAVLGEGYPTESVPLDGRFQVPASGDETATP